MYALNHWGNTPALLVCFSFAVINTMIKSKSGEVRVYLAYTNINITVHVWGKSEPEFKQKLWRNSVAWWLTLWLLFIWFSYGAQAHLHKNGADFLTSISNQDNGHVLLWYEREILQLRKSFMFASHNIWLCIPLAWYAFLSSSHLNRLSPTHLHSSVSDHGFCLFWIGFLKTL